MANPAHFHFSTVTGIFLQDEATTDPDTFDYVSSNFGLIPRPYPSDTESEPKGQKSQWERLAFYIDSLNRDSPPQVQYKLLFLGRHGQGIHNVAEARYGTEMWDCHYSLLPGDSHGSWFDARLTETGISQARTAHRAWKTQTNKGIPPPQSYYVSPLNRCLATAAITFQESGLPGTEPFKPVIKELLRETIGLHTCDARSTRSAIVVEYPEYVVEEGFTEEDLLYDSKLRESDSARDERLYELLSEIWGNEGGSVLSLTAHSGAITSILSVVGHRVFALATGGVIPVLVRGERRDGEGDKRVVEPWFPKPACKESPIPVSLGLRN